MTVWAKRSSAMPGRAIRSLPSRKLSPWSTLGSREDAMATAYSRARRTQRVSAKTLRPFGSRSGGLKALDNRIKGKKMIKVGDKVPSATLRQVTESGVQEVGTDDFFKGKRVALFAVPGAFTSVC